MKRLVLQTLAITLFLSVSGCCTFFPCHPGTRAVGYVSDLGGNPIKGVTVTLYGYRRTTNAEGCFEFNTPDALPFTLSASANGYKNVEVPSRPGFFIVYVKLASVNSQESSAVQWKEINSYEYKNTRLCR